MRDVFQRDPVVAQVGPESNDYRVSRILDVCLNEIKNRKSTIADCLATHPDETEQLEPLLQVAAELSALSNLQPSSQFKQATRKRLLQLEGPLPVPSPALAPPLGILWRPALFVLVLLAGLGLVLVWAGLLIP